MKQGKYFLFLMNKLCLILVSAEINLQLLPDFLFYLKQVTGVLK